MDASNDYYAVLGVDPQASTSVIKAAFKKLALQYHPDVYRGIDAQERMRGILRAYQVLSDPQARSEYDARRFVGVDGSMRAGPPDGTAPRKSSVSGRTGQGRFAFPDLRETPTTPLLVVLDGLQYQLSSAQAESLKWDGMLRGTTIDGSAGGTCVCQRCHHRWQEGKSTHPATCPACHAGDWAAYLLLRCIHCQAVFTSRELRDPLRGNTLYQPYELFPLCPHCRRSRWCPAENARVQILRAAAARRSLLLWGSVVVVCVVLVLLLVLAVLH